MNPQKVGMHPILSSVVHLQFAKATAQIGCCNWSAIEFTRSLDSYLSISPDASQIREFQPHQLWKALQRGEVIAVEYVNNEGFLFHVRGKVLTTYIDMRVYYCKDHWELEAITSIHRRPFVRSRLRFVLEGVSALAILAVLGVIATDSSLRYTKQGVADWAQKNGYQLVSLQADSSTGPSTSGKSGTTPGSATTGPKTGIATSKTNKSLSGAPSTTQTSKRPSSAVHSNAGSQAGATHNQSGTSGTTDHSTASHKTSSQRPSSSTSRQSSTPHVYAFTFTSGMTVHDISVFLQQHHLVANAYAFDAVLQKTKLDQSIWPGTYIFKTGMSQNQLIQVLKNPPAH